MTREVRSTAAVLALLLGRMAAAQEVAADCSTGNEPVWLCYGEHAICSLDSTVDLDVFEFYGLIGDPIRIVLSGQSCGLDLRLELFDPDGNPVDNQPCTSICGGICSVLHESVLARDGVYTLLISEVGSDQGGNYNLDLQRIPSLTPIPWLDYNQTLVIPMDFAGDQDQVLFQGKAQTNVRLVLSANNCGLDPRLRVHGPDGSVLASGSCDSVCGGGCSFQVDLINLSQTGTYSVLLWEGGFDQGGSFNLHLACVLGQCPNPLPSGPLGTNFCTVNPNSTGSPSTLSASGSAVVADNWFFLRADDVPVGEFGIFFMGQTPLPGGRPLAAPASGLLCIAQPLLSVGSSAACNANQLELRADLTGLPIVAGQSWSFQAWFRDGTGSNTSDGLTVTFQ